jgi:uncharacterized protein
VKEAFLDTSGWFAAVSPREARHREANATYRSWIEDGTRLVTSNLVVAEMQIMLVRFRGPRAALGFLESVYQDPAHEVVFVDRDLERTAIDRWLRKFLDRPLSLTDAISFEIMRLRRISLALALDEHFVVAGYRILPG